MDTGLGTTYDYAIRSSLIVDKKGLAIFMNDKEQFRKEKTCFPLPKSIRSVSTLLFFPTLFFTFLPFLYVGEIGG